MRMYGTAARSSRNRATLRAWASPDRADALCTEFSSAPPGRARDEGARRVSVRWGGVDTRVAQQPHVVPMANGAENMTSSRVASVRSEGCRKNHSFCSDRRPSRAKLSSCGRDTVEHAQVQRRRGGVQAAVRCVPGR